MEKAKKKPMWRVPSHLENISSSLAVLVSYLEYNKPKVEEKFGDRSEEVMNILNEVNIWMSKEAEIIHADIKKTLSLVRDKN
jgi:Zn-dependent oligopeptidase